jgi:tRNA threonylcarbamoyl adenosine modification protein YeaZ
MTVRLAIDSTSDRLSIAADRAEGAPASAALQGARRHAGALLPLIDEVLGRIGATARDVSIVAVADGPGSFTGIRVSFAAAKALAAEGATLVTAPSLLVRAGGVGISGPTARVLAVSSALRGEVYAGIWHLDLDHIEEIMAPRTISARDIPSLPPFDRAVGDGPEDFLAAVRARREWPEAATMLRLIDVPGGARVIPAPLDFEPHYGRPAEAAAKWEREHGRPLPDSPGHTG